MFHRNSLSRSNPPLLSLAGWLLAAFALPSASAQVPPPCQADWLPTFGGAPGADNDISCLVVFDDGSGPALIAGGGFHFVGGIAAERIARWDGSHWSALGGGFTA